jgi:toxin YoeB
MEIILYDQALEDLAFWKRSGQKIIAKKITSLIEDIRNNPYSGLGKPEGLKHELSGWWSRRINKEHRLIYRVDEDQIHILSMRFHYTL